MRALAQLFDTGDVQGAVGAFWVKPGSADESAGLVYTGITAGDVTASFTGGIAFPFFSRGGFEDNPILILGGEVRATSGVKLISENWVLPGEGSVLAFGVRIIAGRTTVELAAVTSTEESVVFPLVNFSLTW